MATKSEKGRRYQREGRERNDGNPVRRRENYFFPRGHHPRGARPGRYMPEACTLSRYPSYLTSRYGNTSKHNDPEGDIMGMMLTYRPLAMHLEFRVWKRERVAADPTRSERKKRCSLSLSPPPLFHPFSLRRNPRAVSSLLSTVFSPPNATGTLNTGLLMRPSTGTLGAITHERNTRAMTHRGGHCARVS